MCCLQPPEAVDGTHKVRFIVIVQLVIEVVLCLCSLFTVRDFGYLGVIAAAFAISGTSATLARGCGRPQVALRVLLVCNTFAIVFSLVHIALTIYLLVTIPEWVDKESDRNGMKILLSVLLLFYVGGEFMRAYVIYRLRLLRKAPGAGAVTPTPAIAQGVPVALGTDAPGTAPQA